MGDLEAMNARLECIGSHPDLLEQARLWDGDETHWPDPIEAYLQCVEQMREESDVEGVAREAAQGIRPRRAAVSVADNGDATYAIVDGNATF